jgi:VWFA-related protein
MSKALRVLFYGLLSLLILSAWCFTQEKAPSSAPNQANSPAQSAAQTAAQGKAEEPYKSATVLKFTTRLVIVDVIATDHKGNPVTDLKREDFSIQEDGKEQETKVFAFESPLSSPAPLSAPKLPANIFTNAPRYSTTKALNVLLLDALNTRTADQTAAKEHMLEYLEKLPSDQPVAVYALGTKLRLIQDFTTDPTLLKNAVKGLKAKSSPVLNNPAGGSGINETLPGAMQEFMPEGMREQMQAFQRESVSMQMDMRVGLTLAALNAIARSLAGYPGRKNLIWMSQSFPLAILPDSNAVSPRDTSAERNYTAAFDKTATILTDAQVAVYPIDVGALVNSSVISSLSNTDSSGNYLGQTLSGRSGTSVREGAQGISDELGRTSNELFAEHSTMNELAEETGGKAFYNRNDLTTAITSSLQDGGTYYTLGYYPDNKDWNGKFRKIHVKVDRPGVKLRYRMGYFAVNPRAFSSLTQEQKNADFGQALSLDYPASTAVTFQARFKPPSLETKNKVIINFAVDPRIVSFEQQADGKQHAAVDCGVAVYSRKGKAVDVFGNTANAALTSEQFANIMKAYFPCNVAFDLAPGDYILRMGVRDANTGLIGSTNAMVTVPPAPAAAAPKAGKAPGTNQ